MAKNIRDSYKKKQPTNKTDIDEYLKVFPNAQIVVCDVCGDYCPVWLEGNKEIHVHSTCYETPKGKRVVYLRDLAERKAAQGEMQLGLFPLD
jgi:nitrous oxide reductase accessory protein NosL